MRRKLKFWYVPAVILASVVSGLPGAVTAEPAMNPAPSVAEILSKTSKASGVFVETSKSEARHIQSGLICPLTFPNLNLWHLQIYNSPRGLGTDVGCDYGRQGSDGVWAAKLTLYAIKGDDDVRVDKAFAGYQAEVMQAYPDAKASGPAITFKGQPPSGMEDVRSETYNFSKDGKTYRSNLIVAVKSGWVIEIRGTSTTTVATTDEAAASVGDMVTPTFVLMQALSSLGTQ